MGWRGVTRSLVASARRVERAEIRAHRRAASAAARYRRELVAQQAEYNKWEERQRAAHEVEVYEHYVRLILSLHRECSERWDWVEIARRAAPTPPTPASSREAYARAAAEAYRPSFTDTILFRTQSRRDALVVDIETARGQDAAEHEAAMRAHAEATASWQWLNNAARGVRSHDAGAFRAVIEHLAAFDDLEECGTSVVTKEISSDAVRCDCSVGDREVVPEEERKLTATGKLSVKQVPRSKYWSMYQDHVCSAALRVAREALALLPIERVVVNVDASQFDSSTGHNVTGTLLAASFTRDRMHQIAFDRVDPSDAMRNFDHRMQFKKTAGFALVEPMDLAEKWASSTARAR